MDCKKLLFLLIVLICNCNSVLISQNTVGTISNSAGSFDAYTLFTLYTETFLINNCGEVVNQWSSNYPPGNAVYLLENGNLLRAGRTDSSDIVFGGTGGRIELFDWNGNLIWGTDYDTPEFRQHHDVFPMPNGNILILAATVLSEEEAINAGRDPSLLTASALYNEQIIEIEPTGLNSYNVIWEWNLIDHVIQDFDPSKENFGVVGLNPQLLDINFTNGLAQGANWIHANSIQYNTELDQIIFNSRNLSELYIIDHSTTTSEASSHSGGTYGKGGDFLYRWGNPQSYQQGTEDDRQLYGQHYPHWIDNGLIDEGKIILFNNGNGRTPSFSEVFIIDPPTDSPGNYSYANNTSYGPVSPDYIYSNSGSFYSNIVSSAQRLPNGNILICAGRDGDIFEIDENENIVWEYIVPINNIDGGILAQGQDPDDINNLTFRAIKYAPNYPGLIGKDLTPGLPIELNSHLNEACSILDVSEQDISSLTIYPNPVRDLMYIKSNQPVSETEIYNIFGERLLTFRNSNEVDMSNLSSGMYLCKINVDNNIIVEKVLKN